MFFSVAACTGCLHGFNQYSGFVGPSAPSVVPPLLAWKFNEGGAIHGLGHAFFLWPVPVSPALSQEIEDLMDRWEKNGTPILGPIKGEYAPVFCMDPPSEKEIYDTLPPIKHLVPYLIEVQRNNVRFRVEMLVDQIDQCRFYPLAGPCQLHHCHFKATVWWDETTTMGWPVPWSYTDHKQEVLYMDKDHLHRCGEPGELTGPGGSLESYGAYAPALGTPVAPAQPCAQGAMPGACSRCSESAAAPGSPASLTSRVIERIVAGPK